MHFPLSHQRPVSWQPARHHPYHDPTLVAAMDGVTADEDGGGPSPSPRRFHTADHVCIDGHDYVVIFGGGVDDVFYNDVHLFDSVNVGYLWLIRIMIITLPTIIILIITPIQI
eukprot:gb/GECH01008119.1/.p1 GENE.gb/GECH01008119.1/~~gb/GECH01008119.1/.p1  ORF type:complete len:113 (+),score=9.19 gb/GECH01008119.1/:1-339(+)